MQVTMASLLAETLEPGPAPPPPLALRRAGCRDGCIGIVPSPVAAEELG